MGKTQIPPRALQNSIFVTVSIRPGNYWANLSLQQNFHFVMEKTECLNTKVFIYPCSIGWLLSYSRERDVLEINLLLL